MTTFPSLCSPCVTYRTLCHAIGYQVLPNHPVIPHPPVDYCRVFTPILYFQPSPAQGDSRLTPTSLFFYRERYGFECARVPREAEDFPRGDEHFKHVPPPKYLIYLSPKDLFRKVLFKLDDRSDL